jgi:hypothetical protein
VSLRFLGKETQNGNSPTLWEDDGDWLFIQGFTDLEPSARAEIGAVPDGEAVIRVPKKLMRYLKDGNGATEL